MKRRLLILPVLIVVAAAAIVLRAPLLGSMRQAIALAHGPVTAEQRPARVTAGPLVASGTIEARTLDIGSPDGGRIAALHVAEGQTVSAGELLAEMDTGLLDARLAQAQAAGEAAAAQLALLRAGPRPADTAVARAALAEAQAGSAAAQTAQADAQSLLKAPNDLDVKIAGAQAQVKVAEAQVSAAQADATAADLTMGLWGRTVALLAEGADVPLPSAPGGSIHVNTPPDKLGAARLQWNLASQQTWQAHAALAGATAAHELARQNLADLRSQRADQQSLKAQADSARAAYAAAEAATRRAQADLDALLAGAPQEQIDAAAAQAQQATEAVHSLEVQRDQARIKAPEAGIVSSVVLQQGEVAAPGSAIIRTAGQTTVTLTVYVPETDLGRVSLGEAVQAAVDSYPGRTFRGTVTRLAEQAEFTPKNVQTQSERVNTVFAVKIVLDNPAAILKPGMPADARFCDSGGAAACSGAAEADSALAGPTPLPGLIDSLKARLVPGATTTPAAAPPAGSSNSSALVASGSIEVTQVHVSSEMAGRVVSANAQEGLRVSAGDLLVLLDGKEIASNLAQAQAAVTAARAELARISAPARPTEVEQAKAKAGQAQAALEGAGLVLKNAREQRDTPQQVDAQINAARGQVQAAAAQIDAARAQLKSAQVLQESLPDPGSDQDKTRRAVYDQNVSAAEANVRAAESQQAGAQATLAQLLAIRAKPVAADAAVHRAEGQVAQAEAALGTAQAAVAQVMAPVHAEAIAAAQAKVRQAEAGVALLKAEQDKLAVRSPCDGTIGESLISAGEVAQPGIALYTILDMTHVKLKVYVPTDRIGQVKLGQAAQVNVDAYPRRPFVGKVTHIDDKAEFSPKNIQTQEERARTVFAVEISLDNSDGALRPGMPADANLYTKP